MAALPWAIAFLFLGIATYLVVPVAIAPYLELRWRNKLAQHYFNIAMLALDRGMLIARKHGGYSLVPSSYDASMEAEKVTIGDENFHFEDPLEFSGSLKSRRFSLADEVRNVINTPRLAELGEEFYHFYHESENQIQTENDEGEQYEAYTGVLSIPEAPRMVNIRNARRLFPGSASPKLAESVKDDIKKSQLGYKSRNYVDLMIGLVALGVGFGMIVLADYAVGLGGGGGQVPSVDVGLFIAGGLL